MTSPAPFEPVADILTRTLNIKHVYGDPIQRGDTVVIPVASVAYGFGAGGGQGRRRQTSETTDADTADTPEGRGAGGGGGARMTPVGVLEIGPNGTRYTPFNPLAPLLGAIVTGLVAGWLLARRR